jgi:hypothetical protein
MGETGRLRVATTRRETKMLRHRLLILGMFLIASPSAFAGETLEA